MHFRQYEQDEHSKTNSFKDTGINKLNAKQEKDRPIELKPLNEQVIVITGASSGIGLVTARMAAEQGAKIVAAARNEQALIELVHELKSQGHDAIYVKADVGREEEVSQIAKAAIEAFGRFDT